MKVDPNIQLLDQGWENLKRSTASRNKSQMTIAYQEFVDRYEGVLKTVEKNWDKLEEAQKNTVLKKWDKWKSAIEKGSRNQTTIYQVRFFGLFIRIFSAIRSFFSGKGLKSLPHRGIDLARRGDQIFFKLVSSYDKNSEEYFNLIFKHALRETEAHLKENILNNTRSIFRGPKDQADKYDQVGPYEKISHQFIRDFKGAPFILIKEGNSSSLPSNEDDQLEENIKILKETFPENEFDNLTKIFQQGTLAIFSNKLTNLLPGQGMDAEFAIPSDYLSFVVEKQNNKVILSINHVVKATSMESGTTRFLGYQQKIEIDQKDFAKDWTNQKLETIAPSLETTTKMSSLCATKEDALKLFNDEQEK